MRTTALLVISSVRAWLFLAPGASADEPGSFVEPVEVIHEASINAGRVSYGWAVSELGDGDGDGEGELISAAILLDHREVEPT